MDRITFLKQAILEISGFVRGNPTAGINTFLKNYQDELNSLTKSEIKEKEVVTPPKESDPTNLFLYIGAFLIVASVIAFLGFNWSSISGLYKSLMVTMVAFLFGTMGWFLRKQKKIEQAGDTFLAIGSLLIPFVGIAWYKFYLQYIGMSGGMVWFIFSIISIFVYLMLTLSLKSRIYSYMSGWGVVSFIMAFINIQKLPDVSYVLGGIMSSYVLTLGALIIKRFWKEGESKFITEPLETSAKFLMPISSFIGAIFASIQGKLVSVEFLSAVSLVSIYYVIISYTLEKVEYLSITLTGIIIFITILLRLMSVSWMNIGNIMAIVGLGYWLAGLFIKIKKKNSFLSGSFWVLSLILMFITNISFLFSGVGIADYKILFILDLLFMIFVVATAWYYKSQELVIVSNMGIYAMLWVWSYLNGYPLLTTTWMAGLLGIIFFGLGMPKSTLSNIYRWSGLVTMVVASRLFASIDVVSNWSIASMYILGFFVAFNYLWQKSKDWLYIGGAIFWLGLEMNVYHLGIRELQVFSILTGIYLLIWGYLKKRELNDDIGEIINWLGVSVLFVAGLIDSFGNTGGWRAIVFLMQGVGLLSFGFWLKNKFYRYVGAGIIIAAVLSQTYVYVLGLPRWIIIGLLGISFLITALIGLARKK